jgi:hypothetical protein
MDLGAAHERNAKADKLTRLGMALCFVLTGGILLGTLAIATPSQNAAIVAPSASK